MVCTRVCSSAAAVARYTQAREQHISQCLSAATARESVDTLLRDGVTMLTSAGGFGGCFVTQGPLTGPDATEETRRDFVQKRATLERALKRRFDRAIEVGELSSDTASEDLARFYSVMVQGLALQAQHGGTKKQLLRVVDIAMARWPNKKRP
jgi:hypothetical protein